MRRPFLEHIVAARRHANFIEATAGLASQQCAARQDSLSYRDKLWEGLHCGSVGDGTRSKETTRWLAVLSGLCLVLLALVIWLATEVADNRHAISQLRSDVTRALDNDASAIAILNATSGWAPDPWPPDPRWYSCADRLVGLTGRCARNHSSTERTRHLPCHHRPMAIVPRTSK